MVTFTLNMKKLVWKGIVLLVFSKVNILLCTVKTEVKLETNLE